MVEVENLHFRYGSHVALAGVNFCVPAGTLYGILGPNGSGKSTLFRILATMLPLQQGRVRVAGLDLSRQSSQIRKTIGVVFQSPSLDGKLTVRENLEAQGHLYGLCGNRLRERVERELSRMGLETRQGDLAGTLSGGLRRRLEVAKALLHEPRVLVLDEPSTGLDPIARRDLIRHLRQLCERDGITVLLTTHILEEAEQCHRLLLLHRGRSVAEGTPEELKRRVRGDVVVFESADPEALRGALEQKFGLQSDSLNGLVRVEIPNGHRFIAEAVEAFPGLVTSVALHKPTLEDVFVDETGARLC